MHARQVRRLGVWLGAPARLGGESNMRTLLRVGGIAGMLAGASALALAPQAGIAAAALLAPAGFAAGLATAKWLPSAWYGRQLRAGLCSSLLVCVIAAPATLLALLAFAPRGADVTLLAIGPVSLAPLASLAGGGLTADALAVGVGTLAALVLAALSARIFAADKGARFVQAVSRAREASQPLRAESVFGAALGRRTAVPLAAVAGGAGATGGVRAVGAPQMGRPTGAQPVPAHAAPPRRTLAPATPPEGIAGSNAARRTMGPPAAPRRTAVPAPDLHALPPEPEPRRPFAAPLEEPAPAPPTPGASALKRRGGRPPAARLTPEMIEALAAWARDTEEDEDDGEDENEDGAAVKAGSDGKERVAARKPVESSYLNAPAPTAASKRKKRKKNATRDWIC